ncbi:MULTISPECIES: zinc ribbon domain-containing protein [unclassified Treponema]|uniref:zinc ribbon domain-containing protein n=1 Tax=unclassified Treponema TaxID=2638727 RepID=UPI0020A2F131|nr:MULTISPECIES: zinc ribbon domain-containing protein [unclassified Treponema]UTC67800.1 zinc ribbon domain-containing protein [Treponema sp. OMZ 789]UTC70525.1 zinc ribbon domain-containing protein [Treponema sp. OMZ 790]UTC73237.1 zinc ribbon domain-containing protein [Treponema sp. OMZ 791]
MDNDVLEKLRALQDILARKNELETEILDAPKALTQQEELLEKLKSGYIEKNSEYEELRKGIAVLKADLFEAEQKREKAEKAMDNIETQREYEILQKEIDDSTAKTENIRKDLQRLEGQFKILDTTIKQEEELIEQTENELKEHKLLLDSEVAEKQGKVEHLKEEEKKLSPGLSDETMFKFDRIIRNKQGVGIVSVQGNVCMGCHMILPAQFVNEVRSGHDIKFCPYCSRILFYEESELTTEQEAFFNDSDMGGLADLDDLSNDDFLSSFGGDKDED